ncbi:hypothetical protein EYF80_003239 [Liparis tanakae]|uniref:Uncharacterized protein n=1 Tax=Liparis tanakae TaxID=230148 RepID=A0A4Z2J8H1_9TELE|nr:hypothetical protein EYF80_003239 [Liparis tanakae]
MTETIKDLEEQRVRNKPKPLPEPPKGLVQYVQGLHGHCLAVVVKLCDQQLHSPAAEELHARTQQHAEVFGGVQPARLLRGIVGFDSLRVCRESPQEEEVVLAEGGEQAVALQTALRLQPRGRGEPRHHVLHQVLQVTLAILEFSQEDRGSHSQLIIAAGHNFNETLWGQRRREGYTLITWSEAVTEYSQGGHDFDVNAHILTGTGVVE